VSSFLCLCLEALLLRCLGGEALLCFLPGGLRCLGGEALLLGFPGGLLRLGSLKGSHLCLSREALLLGIPGSLLRLGSEERLPRSFLGLSCEALLLGLPLISCGLRQLESQVQTWQDRPVGLALRELGRLPFLLGELRRRGLVGRARSRLRELGLAWRSMGEDREALGRRPDPNRR